jgi:branched-chain amino acid transport system permease protein
VNLPVVLVRNGPRWGLASGTAAIVWFAVALLPVLVLPLPESRLWSMTVAMTVALWGLGLLVGPAEQLALGHGAFVGTGAYLTAILIARYGWPFPLALAMSGLVAFAGGAVVGVPALRVRGQYLAMVSLSLAVVFPMLIQRFSWFTGGSSGPPVIPDLRAPTWLPLPGVWRDDWLHLAVVIVAVPMAFLTWNLNSGVIGRSVRAGAQNDLAAATMGVPVGRRLMLTYASAATIAAVAGGMEAMILRGVTTERYDVVRSLVFYAVAVFGGAAFLTGAIIGAVLMLWVPWASSRLGLDVSPNLWVAVALIVVTSRSPQGLAPVLRRLGGRFVTVVDLPPPRGETPARP